MFFSPRRAWNATVSLFALPLYRVSRAVDRISPAMVDPWLARRTAGHGNFLVQGDRRAFAERAWPAARYPTLYQNIPADVRRSVSWDGRLLGGNSVSWLAWRHVSPEVIAGLARASGRIGIRAGAVTAVMLSAVLLIILILGGSFSVPYPAWSEGISIMPRLGWYATRFLDAILLTAGNLGMVWLASLLLTPAFMAFAFWRGMSSWWGRANEALATPTRDSLVVFKHKADVRQAEYLAYCRQVDRAIQLRAEGQPIITVGRATGVLRARGDMEAPNQGQEMALDGDSIRQHTLILGGTGAGKTRLAVRPLFNRIMQADWGPGHRIGAYVTDGKGTLWQDLEKSGSIASRDDVVIVGTGPGHFAIDPLEGMTPLEVATTLKAVSGQVAGAPSDDFWPESASLLILHCATIARALDLDDATVDGPDWTSRRPWSLLGLARLATDQKATDAAVLRLLELDVERDEHPGSVRPELEAALDGEDTKASLEWLRGTWATMAGETKGGIIANVNIILGKLGGAGELRDRFCTGRWTGPTADVDHALDGGILLIAVGETEWGMVGKVISVWLKTRLYVAARKRLQNNPQACRATSCAMVADEWQMLATTGPDSDASFWNVARETGVFLIASTQSLAALKQVLGNDATANLVNLLRTKIVLKTEEIGTLDYCVKLAGETLRGIVVDDDFYETQGQRELERPDIAPAPNLTEAVTLGRILPAGPNMPHGGMRSAARLDRRFISAIKNDRSNSDSIIGQQQAAYWRQEDKEKEARGNGLQFRPKVTLDELLLGSGLAFAIVQRAGGDRTDIIDLQDV